MLALRASITFFGLTGEPGRRGVERQK
jgi:hypothetical protein